MIVEAEQSPPSAEVVSGPDDIAFVEAPSKEFRESKERRSRRSAPVPAPVIKKPEAGGLMGLFGSLRKPTKPEPQRRKSRPQRDEMTETERDEKRVKRERRRSVKPETDVEGFTTDAGPVNVDTEVDDMEAMRAERRARRRAAEQRAREVELQEAEERRARRERQREQRERELREEMEREARRREEKQARRAAREERRAREEQEAREAQMRAEAKAAERRERRRTREPIEMSGGLSRHASKADRRRSERRSEDEYARYQDERPRVSRRKTAPDPAEPPRGYGMPGKEKTSSWVNSQVLDPPEAPPIVPTVLDMPPSNENGPSLSSDEEARRRIRRQARRRSKYPDMADEDVEELRSRRRESRRVREGAKSSSGDGDFERENGMRRRDSAYEPPSRAPSTKRTSWFKKLTSL